MATVGTTSVGGSTQNSEGTVKGIPVTMPESGDISSISFHGAETTTNGAHAVKGVLYDGSGNVLGETSARSDITFTLGWWELTFAAPVNVAGSASLVLAVAVGTGAGNLAVSYAAGSSGDGRTAAITYPTVPDPTTLTNDANQYSIYATYTASGGSVIGSVIGGKLIGRGVLTGGSLI